MSEMGHDAAPSTFAVLGLITSSYFTFHLRASNGGLIVTSQQVRRARADPTYAAPPDGKAAASAETLIAMTGDMPIPDSVVGAFWDNDVANRSDVGLLRTLVVAAGICWSVVFVVIGLRYDIQMYADGSIFAYSVAVQDVWAFHWHNISGRLFVYLFSYVPAETYVELTGDASGAITVHGFLFFVAPFLGLMATWATDRSSHRVIFGHACLSTACLCPLVFGFPTEMWMAHALFWPTLAVCHYARGGVGGIAVIFAALLALVFTHPGALIFALAILATFLLRGRRDAAFLRAAGAFFVVVSIWTVVQVTLPPDDYVRRALWRAALRVFDVSILTGGPVLLLFSVVTSYGIAFLVLRRLTPTKAHVYAGAIIALVLAAYWLWFDHALQAGNRYYLRTLVVIATPMLGLLATVAALRADGKLRLPGTILPRLAAVLTAELTARAIAGAILLVMLVHAVETAKFVAAWSRYKDEVRGLATGATSDPALGDPHFVSSDRIGSDLNRLSWSSTTHFLSVLVAPKFAPARLVVDPREDYFWLSCGTAMANQEADRVIPAESRRLVRIQACLHR
jgi:hypothetical protein